MGKSGRGRGEEGRALDTVEYRGRLVFCNDVVKRGHKITTNGNDERREEGSEEGIGSVDACCVHPTGQPKKTSDRREREGEKGRGARRQSQLRTARSNRKLESTASIKHVV